MNPTAQLIDLIAEQYALRNKLRHDNLIRMGVIAKRLNEEAEKEQRS